jgi:hypothetical protein
MTQAIYSFSREVLYAKALSDIRHAAEHGASPVTLLAIANKALNQGQILLDAEFKTPFKREVAA